MSSCVSRMGVPLLVFVLFVCANVLQVDGQRGKLSTAVARDKPRWIPRSSVAAPPSSSSPSESDFNNNNTSAINVDKNKVSESEEDVLPTRPVAITPAPTAAVLVAISSEDKKAETPKEAVKDGNKVEEKEADRPKNVKDVIVVVSDTDTDSDAAASTVDAKDSAGEKVPTKRDLPFVIQSSAGLPLNENLLRGFTPIHERYDDLSFDQDSRPQQLLQQRSDNEYNGNTPQVFMAKQPQQQQQQQQHHQPQTQQEQQASHHSFTFSSPHPHTSNSHFHNTYHHHQQQHQQPQQSVQQATSFNPFAYHQTSNTAYHQSLGSGGSGSHLSYQAPASFAHHLETASSAPTALKLASYNPYSNSPHVSIYTAAAPSNKFATLSQVQSPYLNYASQSPTTGAFTTSYPYGLQSAGAGQYVGYATTVQPQFVHYQASAAAQNPSTAGLTNGQTLALQQANQLFALGRIPHNQPITDYSYHNPNIIHAHNQNLFASNFAKVSNPSSVFNHANGQSLYQLSPYPYPVQAAFQVGTANVAPGTANVKPYPVHHFQQQQQATPASTSSLALTGSSPTLATPQYKHFSGATLSAAAAYNINRNEGQLGYSANGPTIATLKVNPYAPQTFGQQFGSLNPQQQQSAFAFAYAKPISSFGQYQPAPVQQQSALHASTHPYTSPTYHQQATQLLSPAASANNQQTAYIVNAQSFYGSPNKYQSTFAQLGGTPHKVLYSSH